MSGRKAPLPEWVYEDLERRKQPHGDGRAPLSLSGWERIIDIRKRRHEGRL